MDALSEFLRVVNLSGALFFHARCTAPWRLRSPPARAFAPYIGAPASYVIEFHLLVEGRCTIRVGAETVALAEGDIVMLPHGDPHEMSNGAGGTLIDSEAALPTVLGTTAIGCANLGEGGGETTRFVCGYLASDARLIAPALQVLPRLVRVPMRDDAQGRLLERTIDQAVDEASRAAPGSAAVMARLAEVLFVEALRRHLVRQPPARLGWLAGATDPIVGRALAALHRAPAHAWTLEELAAAALVSRATLSERFARCLGQGPIAYLTEWRLELAAETLRKTNRAVVQIGLEVGYESEAAFNRAFKRRFLQPPARYRRSWRDAHSRLPAATDPRSSV